MLNRHGRHSKRLRLTPVRSVDADLIISVVALALVGLIGANTWLLLSVRDRINKMDRRMESQTQRLWNKLIEWVEGRVPPKRGK